MRKFSKSEKENLIQLVVKADIRRLSLEETTCLIKERIGKDTPTNYVYMLKNRVTERERIHVIISKKTTRIIRQWYIFRIYNFFILSRKDNIISTII